MKKANVLKSQLFHMDEGDVLHMLFVDIAGNPATITLNSVSTDGTDNRELPPYAPVALDASDVTATTFSANVNLMENTLGFYLDVATDSAFTSFVAGYNNLNIGLVSTYLVVGLSNAQTYYYRFRGYNDYGTGESSNVITTLTDIELVADADGNVYTYVTIGTQQWMVENLKTTKYADGTAIPNVTASEYTDWYLPSLDELQAMYDNLHLFGVGGFTNNYYWSSTEFDQWDANTILFTTGVTVNRTKSTNLGKSRPVRSFTAGIGDYALRDVGVGGGLIFYIDGTTYYEASNNENALAYWSETQDLVGTTSSNIGEGQNNTNEIVAMGYVSSAAKICYDLKEGGWINDTTGAYCYYDNDIANKTDYGALYNWYAVDNAHGLAPTGWRVPAQADFDTLVAYTGGVTLAGGVLKEIGLAHWLTPNTSATDDYGFTALGGGQRLDTGSFDDTTESCLFWQQAFARQLFYNSAEISEIDPSYTYGYSVRCMRDVV